MFSGVQCTCLASQVAVRPCRASSALRRWPKWKSVGDGVVFVFMVLAVRGGLSPLPASHEERRSPFVYMLIILEALVNLDTNKHEKVCA